MDQEEKEDREEEMSRLRLMFTTRKRVKISEFEYGESKENIRINEWSEKLQRGKRPVRPTINMIYLSLLICK
jgi:hypothetical protein